MPTVGRQGLGAGSEGREGPLSSTFGYDNMPPARSPLLRNPSGRWRTLLFSHVMTYHSRVAFGESPSFLHRAGNEGAIDNIRPRLSYCDASCLVRRTRDESSTITHP